jgi:hypothetical protein
MAKRARFPRQWSWPDNAKIAFSVGIPFEAFEKRSQVNYVTTTREAGFVLFDVISAKQKATQLQVINRSGSLPFREQPAAFHHIVASFGEGVRQEKRQIAT